MAGGGGAGLRPVPAAPVVAGLLAAGELPGPEPLEPLLRAVAPVRPAGGEQGFDGRLVPRHALALVERSLVPVETEPCEPVEDALDRFERRALPVGILDPEDELPAVAPGVEPAEERGARASHVQEPGGARGESGTDGHRGILARNGAPARTPNAARRGAPVAGRSPWKGDG